MLQNIHTACYECLEGQRVAEDGEEVQKDDACATQISAQCVGAIGSQLAFLGEIGSVRFETPINCEKSI